jgi:type III pantothenate kinase
MLLAIDVGNTNITVGIFREQGLIADGRISTQGPRTVDEYTIALRALLDNLHVEPGSIQGVIISSVVPRATVPLKQALRALVKPTPLVLGQTIKAPIINRYRIPGQVGQDRLVNAVAALHLYGGPAIVVDFGTAITIDLVSRRREYLGGLIVPGVEIALEALIRQAALLPRIELTPPRELLGRDTVSSMQGGLFFGYSALCDGIVERIKARHASRATVVATGGYASLIAPYCKTLKVVNPHLTLQGLELICRSLKRGRKGGC